MKDDGSDTLEPGSEMLRDMMSYCPSKLTEPQDGHCQACEIVASMRALLRENKALKQAAFEMICAHHVGGGKFVAPKDTAIAIYAFMSIIGIDVDSIGPMSREEAMNVRGKHDGN